MQQLRKFKYNSDLFNQALKNQPKYAIPDDLGAIVLGNDKAETIITMVSNPYCGPCAKAHQTLDNLLKDMTNIQLKIVFTTNNRENDLKTKVAKHFGALSRNHNNLFIKDAMNEWYNSPTKNYEKWAAKYPTVVNDETEEFIQNQRKWCDMAEITLTPTIFINGHKLPDPYRLEDIKHLLD